MPKKLVKIENSDGDPSKWPDTTTIKLINSTHIQIFYELDKNSYAYSTWMEVLGDAIAKKIKSKEKLVLDQLPYGYKLFVQYKYSTKISPKELPMCCRTIKDGDECIERTDVFVYGDPRGFRFRSKHEFMPHCLWLYFNRKNSCNCNHCDKDAHQKRKEDIRASRLLVRFSKQKFDTKIPKKIKKINENIDNSTLSSILNDSKYRRGEIVWVSDTMLRFKSFSQDHRNYSVYSAGFSTLSNQHQLDNYRYLVKLLVINKYYEYPTFAISPWLSVDCEELIFKYSSEIYSSQILKAILICTNVQKHYTMGLVYNYIVNYKELDSVKDPVQKQRIINAKNYPHYSEIWFGTEKIKLPDNRIQFTGDIYTLKNSDIKNNDDGVVNGTVIIGDKIHRKLKIGDHVYISKNYIQEEYTVDLEDIAGRFYPNMDPFTKVMNVKEEKASREELFDKNIDQTIVVADNGLTSSFSKIDNKCFMDNNLSNKQMLSLSIGSTKIYKSEDDEDATITDDDNNSMNDKTDIKESIISPSQEYRGYESEENDIPFS
ncbi:11793_t:CDS:2 [Entrophospora sp. SA101]|nr:11793_t:CDS:2 [Entrophospora sp. SA101]